MQGLPPFALSLQPCIAYNKVYHARDILHLWERQLVCDTS